MAALVSTETLVHSLSKTALWTAALLCCQAETAGDPRRQAHVRTGCRDASWPESLRRVESEGIWVTPWMQSNPRPPPRPQRTAAEQQPRHPTRRRRRPSRLTARGTELSG